MNIYLCVSVPQSQSELADPFSSMLYPPSWESSAQPVPYTTTSHLIWTDSGRKLLSFGQSAVGDLSLCSCKCNSRQELYVTTPWASILRPQLQGLCLEGHCWSAEADVQGPRSIQRFVTSSIRNFQSELSGLSSSGQEGLTDAHISLSAVSSNQYMLQQCLSLMEKEWRRAGDADSPRTRRISTQLGNILFCTKLYTNENS